MSLQIFLFGKILGIEEFLLSTSPLQAGDSGETALSARSNWVSLLSEVLPRALLAELGLAEILLGSSGGGQFLVVLPQEARSPAEEFLRRAWNGIASLSGGRLRLIWAITENLGDWSDVRRRINDQITSFLAAPLASGPNGTFVPTVNLEAADNPEADAYFTRELLEGFRQSERCGWDPERPAHIVFGPARHTWSLTPGRESIALARHAAPSDDARSGADLATLASRAQGRLRWGVLRGDVDNFGIRIRRAASIEEHVSLSVIIKQFFAGELEVICSMPEFWRRVTVLYSGGDDFAVYGSWDALILLAREIQRLFHRLSEETMRELPGPEGKTISMALSVAAEPGDSFASVYEDAGRKLETAKASGKDCFHLLGRTLEWKQIGEAQELKERMARMVTEFGCTPQFLSELAGFYRDTTVLPGAGRSRWQEKRFDRPWRFYRRLNRLLSGSRERDFQRLRTNLISELIGKGSAQRKLRPAGRVALEWARLSTEG
jgi:CRISPR-associated protein Csm1